MKNPGKLISFGWLLTVLFLFLYSLTQIDLSLTLTRASFWQPIQRAFQQIGYFQRPLSTGLYLAILFFLFLFYFLILKGVTKKWFGSKQIWILVLVTAGLLWWAYNAFSYDLFNYIFDAKIVTFYGQNPYQYKALDFPGDPMLGFMHWTHRTFPYGPAWLVFTVPLSFLGFQKLIPTALMMKGLAVGGYLVSAWLIFKILEATNSKKKWLGLAFFAFNPFMVIEGLVSGHNDFLMMGLAVSGFWFLLKKKYFWAYGLLILSIGVKFATGLLLPVFLWVTFLQLKKQKIDWEKVWLFSFGLMIVSVLGAMVRDELKPWYLLYPFWFSAFLVEKKWVFWLTVSLSLGMLLHYVPFLYLGNWDPPVPLIRSSLTFGFLGLGLLAGLLGQKGLKGLRK